MKVEQLMSKEVGTCTPQETLDRAARIMWERDCGIVPIVDASSRVVGMLTDRDICIAAYTQNRPLSQIPISSIGMKPVASVRPNDSTQTAETTMQKHQVRRLAVIDDGGRLVGMLSLNDLARGAGRHLRGLSSDEIVDTLAAISQPRAGNGASATS